MGGYSEKSLADKLGLKIGDNISILHAPEHYDQLIDDWPVGSSVSRDVLDETFTVIHYFAVELSQLAADFPELKEHLAKSGSLWVSWPKKTRQQGVGIMHQSTDLDENQVREVGLANALVDVKVVAIDDIWSGLKFVWRLKDR